MASSRSSEPRAGTHNNKWLCLREAGAAIVVNDRSVAMGLRFRGDDEESRRLLRRRLAMTQEAAEQPALALARNEIDVADKFRAALAPLQHDLAAVEGL